MQSLFFIGVCLDKQVINGDFITDL